jgi:two-component system CheB/CheR fusion protein
MFQHVKGVPSLEARRRQDAQLDQLLAFVRNAPMSIAIFDRRMTYLATSERWMADYGSGRRSFVGVNHYEAHPDLPDEWKEAHRRGLAGEKLDKKDDVWDQADGTRLWVSWTVSPWRGRGGAIGGIVITAENVTERKRAEEALRASEARLREADQRKDEFLAMLSHELRNPLAPIKSGVEILARAPAGGEAARRAQVIIARQVSHLSHIVDDLLDVTRIARGKIDLRKERVELGELALRCVEDHRCEFAKAGVELMLQPASGPVATWGDRTRLAQVIGNLLQNAAKFCPPGGQTFVSLETDGSGSRALLRIRDTGRGIAPELLPHLFEPFVQARSTLDRKRGGLGLGLAVAKGIVELHGGTIHAESSGADQGATFTIALPLDTTVSMEAGAPSGSAAPARRVLVVEDNVDAAETLRDLLEIEGHQVELAHDGRAALAKARSFQPDVVVCDIGLPEMDGFEVARALRTEPGPSRPTLVALSGYAQPEDIARGREAGFDAHLAKPPSLEALSHLLAGAPARAGTGPR